ncbi:MAG: KpsF/GutQ family sugar-phosphate isomerase [Nitrospinae bacterium]|nr:KpsF/GutQ family sugar-phosphate isomerase [Nitrospinota bacterium]
MEILELAKKALLVESRAVAALAGRIGEEFLQAVDLIHRCQGRVVITGMGKSGLIGKKITSTFASIGTPALFLHPAEGIHGDLGMVTRGDLLLGISNSGETEEVLRLLPAIKRFRVPLIGITGNLSSTLARESDIVLDVGVEEEACPLGLVPTASTTATLAMGDALAVALLQRKGLRKEDFALFHPGGSLGKRLLLKVKDLMHTGKEVPRVTREALLKDVIYEISSKGLGVTSVVDEEGIVHGIVTDGDLRRLMERETDLFHKTAQEIMTVNPKTIEGESLAAQAIQVMEYYAITSLLILDEQRRAEGIVHLHDMLKAGVV